MATKISITGSKDCFIQIELKSSTDSKTIIASHDGKGWFVEKAGKVQAILNLYKSGVPQKDISKKLGVNKSWVSKVLKKNSAKVSLPNQI